MKQEIWVVGTTTWPQMVSLSRRFSRLPQLGELEGIESLVVMATHSVSKREVQPINASSERFVPDEELKRGGWNLYSETAATLFRWGSQADDAEVSIERTRSGLWEIHFCGETKMEGTKYLLNFARSVAIEGLEVRQGSPAQIVGIIRQSTIMQYRNARAQVERFCAAILALHPVSSRPAVKVPAKDDTVTFPTDKRHAPPMPSKSKKPTLRPEVMKVVGPVTKNGFIAAYWQQQLQPIENRLHGKPAGSNITHRNLLTYAKFVEATTGILASRGIKVKAADLVNGNADAARQLDQLVLTMRELPSDPRGRKEKREMNDALRDHLATARVLMAL